MLAAAVRLLTLSGEPPPPGGDAELVEAALRPAGQSAFEELVRRHTAPLRRYVARMSYETPDTDDIVQEAFIRAWSNLRSFNPERARFTTWIHRIAHNLTIDHLRQRSREAPLESAAEVTSNPPDPELIRMRTAIARLPDRQRAAIVLRHVQGFSQQEAAAILDLSEDALESLTARARRTLRRSMGDGQ